MAKSTANSAREIVTSIRLTEAEHAALKALAEHDRRSLSNQLRHMIARDHDQLERQAA